MSLFNKLKRDTESKLYKLKTIEKLTMLTWKKENALNEVMGYADVLTEDRQRMFEYFDTLGVLSHLFLDENGHPKKECKDLMTRPAYKLAIEKLIGVHGGLVCGAFGCNLDDKINEIDNLIKNKQIELKFPEDMWEKK